MATEKKREREFRNGDRPRFGDWRHGRERAILGPAEEIRDARGESDERESDAATEDELDLERSDGGESRHAEPLQRPTVRPHSRRRRLIRKLASIRFSGLAIGHVMWERERESLSVSQSGEGNVMFAFFFFFHTKNKIKIKFMSHHPTVQLRLVWKPTHTFWPLILSLASCNTHIYIYVFTYLPSSTSFLYLFVFQSMFFLWNSSFSSDSNSLGGKETVSGDANDEQTNNEKYFLVINNLI